MTARNLNEAGLVEILRSSGVWRSLSEFLPNGEVSSVNIMLDGTICPGQKLVHFALCKKFNECKQNTSAYTWDRYCHLWSDGASFCKIVFKCDNRTMCI